MMSQATPAESFGELQQLFVDMFQADLVGDFGFGVPPVPPPLVHRSHLAQSQPCTTSGSTSCDGVNKRCSSSMGTRMPQRPGRSGSGPGLSGLSSGKRQREEAWWTTQVDASIGGGKKKQRPSTSSSEEDDPCPSSISTSTSVGEQQPSVTASPVLRASP